MDTLDTGSRWYAARTIISIPWDTTIAQLKRQDFIGWMPIVRSVEYHIGRKIVIEQPLFGPYLFVQLDVKAQRWRDVNYTVGIRRLLPEHNEFPSPVSMGFVEALYSQPSMAEIEELVVDTFAADTTVKILAGAFHGRFAKVLSSHRRSTEVRLSAFGREIKATVPTEQLAAL